MKGIASRIHMSAIVACQILTLYYAIPKWSDGILPMLSLFSSRKHLYDVYFLKEVLVIQTI